MLMDASSEFSTKIGLLAQTLEAASASIQAAAHPPKREGRLRYVFKFSHLRSSSAVYAPHSHPG